MKLSNYQWNKILSLLEKLNIKAKNKNLYVEAMTHNSYKNEHNLDFTYQRLEFLGDIIISKLISCYLYFSNFDEQKMTEHRKMIISGKTMKRASEEMGLIEHAFLGKGVDTKNGVEKIKEDLFESLLGAVYLDQGEAEVYKILKNTILKYYLDNDLQENIDYKSKVQELFQKNISSTKASNKIHYDARKLDESTFEVTLWFDNIKYGVGTGKTIKEAEIKAARETLEKHVIKEN